MGVSLLSFCPRLVKNDHLWKDGKWYPATNIPEEVARSSWHPPSMPCRIEDCGRDAKPAEDAPDIWPLPRRIAIAARNKRLREAGCASGSEAQPVTVRIKSDESDSETASSAERNTTVTYEAPAIRADPKGKRKRLSRRDSRARKKSIAAVTAQVLTDH